MPEESEVQPPLETSGSEPGMETGNVKEPPSSMNPHWYRDPTVLAFMSVPTLGILLAIGFVLTPLIRHMSLRSDIANNRVVDVASFIQANGGSSARGDDALFAIDEVMKSGSPAMTRAVEDVALDSRTDVGVRDFILKSLVLHNRQVANPERLLKEVYSPTLTWQSVDTLRQAGQTTPASIRAAYTANLLVAISGSGDVDATDKDKAVISTALSILPEENPLLASLSQSLDTISEKAAEITSIQDTIVADTSDLTSRESSLSTGPFLLSGYVVSQPDAPLPIYEIQPDNLSTRAYLFCDSTTFQSKGRFQMQVTGGDASIPVQLKQELGGFTQNWPIYSEIDQQWYANRADNEASAQKDKTEIQESRTKIADLRSELMKNISEFNSNICKVNESCENKSTESR